MATSTRSTERFKYGICLNDECPLCKEKKIQQIPMRKDLVCTNPECGKPLRECPPPKTGINKKLIGIIAGAAIGIAAIGVAIYALTGGGDSEPDGTDKGLKDVPQLVLNHSSKTLKIGETDTLNATITPEGTKATFEWKASKDGSVDVQNGIVKAIKGGSGKVRVQAIVGKDTLSAICKYTVDAIEMQKPEPPQPDPKVEEEEAKAKTQPQPTPTPPESGSLKLSYGKYTGQMKNGYPNGQGRLVYSTSRQISQYDSKGRIAQAGESVQGNFKNGFFTFGKHYDANGNLIESLNIGAPAEGVFESK